MKTIAISDFKARCLALLEEVARTGEPLLVTKRGRPLARVSPGELTAAISPQDTLVGSVETIGDIIAPVVRRSSIDALHGALLSQERRRRRRAPR